MNASLLLLIPRINALLSLLILLITSRPTTGSPGWAVQCDGVDDWGTLPIPNVPAEWTFEAWVHFPAGRQVRTGTVVQVVADESDQELLKAPISAASSSYSNADVSYVGTSVLNLPRTYDKPGSMPAEPGKTSHLAIVVNGTGNALTAFSYWNGELVHGFEQDTNANSSSTAAEEELSVTGSATVHLCFLQKVGTFSNARERFGRLQLDDVRFWSKARTQQEIRSTMYSLEAQPSLMHWWKFDEGEGVVLRDSMPSASHGSLAQRRDFSNQKPQWMPSRALNLEQANFTAVVGYTHQAIPLQRYWDTNSSSTTEPNVYLAPDTPARVTIPYVVPDTGEQSEYDVVVRDYRPPIAGNNQCLVLNGYDAYALATNFQVPPSFSMDVWVHPFSLPPAGWTDFGSKHTSSGGNVFLWEVNLVRNDEGRLVPTLYCRLSNDRFLGGEMLYEPQHLALTFDADLTTNTTNATLYRNGEVVFEAHMDDILTNADQQGLPWSMGQDFDNRGVVVPSDFWHGTLDEYRFWSRALTQSEVQHSMQTAIDHGPGYPHLFQTFGFDDPELDDEYTLHGRAKLGPCQSDFQARPYKVEVEEGGALTFELPAFDPQEDDPAIHSLKFELVTEPARGKIVFNGTNRVTYTAEEGGDSRETFSYRVTNRYGQEARHLGLVDIHVLRHAPTIVSLEAVEGRGYESGSEVRIVFSEPTNTPNMTSSKEEDGGTSIQFSPPIAKSLLFNWESATVLKALIADPLDFANKTEQAPDDLIGSAAVTVTGGVKSADEMSVEVNTTSPLLQGSWVSELFLKCKNGTPDIKSGRCLCTSSRWSGIYCDIEVPEDKNSVPLYILVISYSYFAIIVVACTGCAYVVHHNRNSMIVKISQPFFLFLLLGGCLLTSTTIPARVASTTAAGCTATYWVFFLGFSILFGALYTKIWRTQQLFGDGMRMQRKTLTVKDSTFIIAGLLFVNALLLSLWTGLDTPSYQRTVLVDDGQGYALSTVGECVNTTESPYLIACLSMNLLFMCIAVYLCFRARKLPDKFSETYAVNFSTYTTLNLCLIGVPILALVRDDPAASLFVECTLVFLILLAVLVCIFSNLVGHILSRTERSMRMSIQTAIRDVATSGTAARKSSAGSRMSDFTGVSHGRLANFIVKQNDSRPSSIGSLGPSGAENLDSSVFPDPASNSAPGATVQETQTSQTLDASSRRHSVPDSFTSSNNDREILRQAMKIMADIEPLHRQDREVHHRIVAVQQLVEATELTPLAG